MTKRLRRSPSCNALKEIFPFMDLSPMRITVCTFWTPEIELYARWTTENKRAYAERHGYGFHCPPEARTGRPPSWEKCFVMGEAIDRSEWVWWLDADAIVTNPAIQLEAIIDDYFDMIVCHDFNGLNAGSFLLKSGPWAKQFLWDVWRSEQFTHHPWWEQAAMMELLKQERNSLRTKVVEQRLLQSYCEWWQPGDFVLHVPGKPHAERLEILQRIDATAKAWQGGAA